MAPVNSVRVSLETITHNPWHPAYRLSHEGSVAAMKEIAPELLARLVKENPTAKSVSVSFGGVPYAGFERNSNVSQ